MMAAGSHYLSSFNVLLPFTRPGTPLLQDILHTVVLCTLLWYAPRILERRVEKHLREGSRGPREPELIRGPGSISDGNGLQPPAIENATDDGDGDVAEETANQAEADVAENEDITFVDQADDGVLEMVPGIEDNVEHPQPNGAEIHPSSNIAMRNVGKKKAKSLARKDQRRAYNEFMRSQGDAQRARDREVAAAYEQDVAAERLRRAAVEAELEQKLKLAKEKKKQEERIAWENDIARRKKAIAQVRQSMKDQSWADLKAIARDVGGGADAGWVEKLCRAEGIVQEDNQEVVTLVTELGFIVRVSQNDLREACDRATSQESTAGNKEVSWEELGEFLDDVVRRKPYTGFYQANNHAKQGENDAESKMSLALLLNFLPTT